MTMFGGSLNPTFSENTDDDDDDDDDDDSEEDEGDHDIGLDDLGSRWNGRPQLPFGKEDE